MLQIVLETRAAPDAGLRMEASATSRSALNRTERCVSNQLTWFEAWSAAWVDALRIAANFDGNDTAKLSGKNPVFFWVNVPEAHKIQWLGKLVVRLW